MRGGVASVEYDRDGRLLATRDLNDTVRIWSVTSGDVLLALRDAEHVDMSPDGRRILVSGDRLASTAATSAASSTSCWPWPSGGSRGSSRGPSASATCTSSWATRP